MHTGLNLPLLFRKALILQQTQWMFNNTTGRVLRTLLCFKNTLQFRGLSEAHATGVCDYTTCSMRQLCVYVCSRNVPQGCLDCYTLRIDTFVVASRFVAQSNDSPQEIVTRRATAPIIKAVRALPSLRRLNVRILLLHVYTFRGIEDAQRLCLVQCVA